MERYSDEAIRIIDELHTERLDYQSEYIPLIDAAQRLDAYESTGMEPENIGALRKELNQYKELGDLDRLREAVTRQKEYEQFMERWKETVKIAGAVKDIGGARIAELVQADREGRIHIIPIPRRNTCGKCGNFVRVSGHTYGECKLRPHYKPYQSRVCCSKYFEKAMKEMENAQK